MKTKKPGISQKPAFPKTGNRRWRQRPGVAAGQWPDPGCRWPRFLAALAITDLHHRNMIGTSSGNPDTLNNYEEKHSQCKYYGYQKTIICFDSDRGRDGPSFYLWISDCTPWDRDQVTRSWLLGLSLTLPWPWPKLPVLTLAHADIFTTQYYDGDKMKLFYLSHLREGKGWWSLALGSRHDPRARGDMFTVICRGRQLIQNLSLFCLSGLITVWSLISQRCV